MRAHVLAPIAGLALATATGAGSQEAAGGRSTDAAPRRGAHGAPRVVPNDNRTAAGTRPTPACTPRRRCW